MINFSTKIMFSRREYLLVLPWEYKKYENHRQKVQSAVPAIDNRTPLSRNHVALKLKKKQKEEERCSQIQKNNLILLQKLNNIMQTNRVDNNWVNPQPNFLNRIGLYYDVSPYEKAQKTDKNHQDLIKPSSSGGTRKSKCLACTPQPIKKAIIPESRIPWEAEKPPVRKIRSKSVPPQKVLQSLKPSPVSSVEATAKIKPETSAKERSQSCKTTKKKNPKFFNINSPHSIVLTRGSFSLNVNFPSDASVKLKNGKFEKLITPDLCQCNTKNMCSKPQASKA